MTAEEILNEIECIVNQQIAIDDIWLLPQTTREAQLQKELQKLHEFILNVILALRIWKEQ